MTAHIGYDVVTLKELYWLSNGNKRYTTKTYQIKREIAIKISYILTNETKKIMQLRQFTDVKAIQQAIRTHECMFLISNSSLVIMKFKKMLLLCLFLTFSLFRGGA